MNTTYFLGVALVVILGMVLWYLWERQFRRTFPVPGGVNTNVVVSHSAEFELYHNDFSLCSKKIRMCLVELGVPYVSHHIDLIETGCYETLSRTFLAVNPAGLVPVLIHEGHPVYESHEILLYAAQNSRTEFTLVPRDVAAEQIMQEWIRRSSLFGDDPMRALDISAGNCIPGLTLPLFAAMISEIPTHRIIEGLLFHRLKKRPLAFLAMKLAGLKNFSRIPMFKKLVCESRVQMSVHLAALEQHLKSTGGPWIAGAEFTLADVSWAVIFERLREAGWTEALLNPALINYWDKLRSRHSYSEAMVMHQHRLVQIGTASIYKEISRGGYLAALYLHGK